MQQISASGEQQILPGRFSDIDQMVDACWGLVEQEISRREYGQSSVKIRIALAEALINAWKHGNRLNPDLPITFRWRFENELTFEVLDMGAGFDFRSLPDPTRPEMLTAENGRGLFIVKAFARSVEWRDNGRHLIVTFAPPL